MKSITVYETIPNPHIKDKLEVMARVQVGRLLRERGTDYYSILSFKKHH